MIAKVDAHYHLWSAGPHYPALDGDATRFYGRSRDLPRDADGAAFVKLAAGQNVVKSVHVEAHFAPPIDETAHIQRIADEYGFPHAILARVDLAADDAPAVLAHHARSANFRGIRASLNWDEDPLWRSAPRDGLLRDPDWRRGFAVLGARGLSADIMVLPRQHADLAALAASCPDNQIIVNHTGLPPGLSPGHLRDWHDGMARLAQQPNIAVKISGLGMVDHDWTTTSIEPFVTTTLALFGPDRCLFASNWPVDGLHATYDRIWEAFDTLTAGLPSATRAALFHDNAVRAYRL